ncbi:MAG: pyridoxine 5'-phosphate synthase [Candidatus Dadabacteria bacterium]|nr:pyridoxine 5'-phosphate synthase [Candidatus Dadabacteria bacterium]NIQ13009.1 pyridoxine 5'-phosphate synthase [Candidatus Dadabacteria bacterium]
MPALNVNIDHVATLRQARRGIEPDPVFAASIAEIAGAKGIVVHLREDRRHAQERDLELLRKTVKTRLNMEMAATSEMIKIATSIKPDMVTIVPEKREEITTEGGLNVLNNIELLEDSIKKLKSKEIFVSLFIDPDEDQIFASKQVNADMVELHTGSYAEAKGEIEMIKEFELIESAVSISMSNGLRVAAGHGLDYMNVKRIAGIDGIEELNIGHSIISRAVYVGMEDAVRDMVYLCEG